MTRTMNARHSAAALAAVVAALAIPVSSAVADGMHGDTGGGTDTGGTMPQMTTHEASENMSVDIRLSKDAKMGYNLNVRTTAFRWAPWNASKAHRNGQGHAHLYVDGKKVTRLYGPWYFLGDLETGKHYVKVTLNGNDHGDYVHGDKPVAVGKVLTVR